MYKLADEGNVYRTGSKLEEKAENADKKTIGVAGIIGGLMMAAGGGYVEGISMNKNSLSVINIVLPCSLILGGLGVMVYCSKFLGEEELDEEEDYYSTQWI